MFIAKKQLKVVGRDNRVTTFNPGEEVIGFENWGEVQKRSHLNLEYVVEIGGKTPNGMEVKKHGFECSICEKSFKSNHALKIHRSSKHKE
jgi:hypothetical protein